MSQKALVLRDTHSGGLPRIQHAIYEIENEPVPLRFTPRVAHCSIITSAGTVKERPTDIKGDI